MGETRRGRACLCAEGAGEGLVVVKELLGDGAVLSCLPRAVPAGATWSAPRRGARSGSSGCSSGSIPGLAGRWDWESTAYLGLAFD